MCVALIFTVTPAKQVNAEENTNAFKTNEQIGYAPEQIRILRNFDGSESQMTTLSATLSLSSIG